ncbi:MAG: heat-inducible transcriptional repressor HrcA, partial [Clostridia bacterium]|nr:heat-inducible transcriptional repressor HrcA [Clostridia bacterium]
YLEQPHTSAGRIPSQKGYRLYVDSLMGRRRLSREETIRIDELLQINAGDFETTLEAAGKALAEVTGLTSVSTVPQDKGVMLRKVELIQCGRKSALLVLLTSMGVIKSKLYRSQEMLTPEMLAFFSRLLDERLCGLPVESITSETLEALTGELFEYTCALRPLLGEIGEQIAELSGSEVFLGGEANLLGRAEVASMSVRDLLHMLERREALAALIRGIHGVEVRIGTENDLQQLHALSIVAAPYEFQGRQAGAVGIIGPTRMDYAKIVPSLAYFSEVLSRLINNTFGTL